MNDYEKQDTCAVPAMACALKVDVASLDAVCTEQIGNAMHSLCSVPCMQVAEI